MATNWTAGTSSGDVPVAAPVTGPESAPQIPELAPQAADPATGVLGRRVAAALVDIALLTGLLVIVGLAVGQVNTGGIAGYGIWLGWAWSAVYLAIVLVYYFALEASIGRSVGKCLLGLRVARLDGGRPSALAIAGRTLLRLIDWFPVLYLAGFITILVSGRRQRLGDLVARTTVARARSARRPALALTPLALVVLAVAGLSAYRAPWSAQTYRAHGVSFAYPAGWLQESPSSSFSVKSGPSLWSAAFGPGTEADVIMVNAYRIPIPVGAGDLAAVSTQVEPQVRRLFEAGGGALQAGPQQMTMGRLPGLRFQGTGVLRDGTFIDSTLVYAFDGTTEYHLDCQDTQAGAGEVQAACRQLIRTFEVSGPPPPASGAQVYQAHGITFDYPATLREGTLTSTDVGNGPQLWSAALALDAENWVGIGADRLPAPVTPGHLAAITPAADTAARRFMQQIRGTLRAGPQQATMGGLPALQFQGATTVGGAPSGVTLVFAFDARTEYFIFCAHTQAAAAEMERACGQVMRTFKVGKSGQAQLTAATAAAWTQVRSPGQPRWVR